MILKTVSHLNRLLPFLTTMAEVGLKAWRNWSQISYQLLVKLVRVASFGRSQGGHGCWLGRTSWPWRWGWNSPCRGYPIWTVQMSRVRDWSMAKSKQLLACLHRSILAIFLCQLASFHVREYRVRGKIDSTGLASKSPYALQCEGRWLPSDVSGCSWWLLLRIWCVELCTSSRSAGK